MIKKVMEIIPNAARQAQMQHALDTAVKTVYYWYSVCVYITGVILQEIHELIGLQSIQLIIKQSKQSIHVSIHPNRRYPSGKNLWRREQRCCMPTIK